MPGSGVLGVGLGGVVGVVGGMLGCGVGCAELVPAVVGGVAE
jgi:hypothetical protein